MIRLDVAKRGYRARVWNYFRKPADRPLLHTGRIGYNPNMARKQKTPLTDGIRQAIDDSDLSRYAIAKRLKIGQGDMSRFMNRKRGLSQARLDAIADLLGLQVVQGDLTKKPTKRK